MKTTKLLFLSAVALAMPLLGGCGSSDDIQKEGRLSIVYYPGGYGQDYLDYFCKHFLASQKNVSPEDIRPGVDYKLIADPDITYGADRYITSKSRCPDLIISNLLSAKAIPQGLISPLEDVYDTQVQTSKGKKTIREFAMTEAVQQYTVELAYGQTGKFSFAMPWTAIPLSIAYNNTILQKIPHVSSIPVGSDALRDGKWARAPKTVEELKAIFEDAEAYDSRLTKFGWAPVNGSNWLETLIITWWAQRQGVDTEHLYAGEGSYYDFWAYSSENIFKQTGLQDALAQLKEFLIKDGQFANSFPTVGSMTIKTAQQAFAEGRALFCLTGDFFEKEYKSFIEQSGNEYKMMRVPAIDGAVTKEDGVTPLDLSYLNISSCAYVPANAINKKLAKDFLVYTSSEENCLKMSEMTGAIRPFEYDARNNEGYAQMSSFTKSVYDLFYEADDYLVKYPRNVEPQNVSPIYLYEGVSENIFCGANYYTVMSTLKTLTPKQVMVDGTANFDSIFKRATEAFKDWRRRYGI